MKIKYLDSRNLVTGLKALANSVLTSLVWAIPMLLVRYFNGQLQLPFVALVVGVISLIGYIHTWGYFWNKFFK